jgi:chromosome segregation ATPase
MVKKLKTLAVIALLSFTSFSQKDTTRICLEYPIAQKIAIELVQKDSLQSELNITNKILKETQKQSQLKDSVIVSFEKKEIEHKAEVKIFEEKEKLHLDKINNLEETNADLTKKNKRLKSAVQWLGGGLVATLAAVISIFSIK